MTDIIWEDPPRKRATVVSKWLTILEPLKAPENLNEDGTGRWARVVTGKLTSMYSTAGNLRTGNLAVPSGRWEFAARKIEDDLGGLWARYLGE
jgi:hypothetical protein